MSSIFRAISTECRALQDAYERQKRDGVREAHSNLIRKSMRLILESQMAEDLGAVTEPWSDKGTEGAIGLARAFHLSRDYPDQSPMTAIEAHELGLLFTWQFFRCGRQAVAAGWANKLRAELESLDAPKQVSSLLNGMHTFLASGASKMAMDVDKVIVECRETMQTDPFGAGGTALLVKALSLMELCAKDGANHWAEAAETAQQAGRMLETAGFTHLAVAAQTLGSTMDSMRARSVWNLIDQLWGSNPPQLVTTWAKHRAESGKPFLFPTQHRALVSAKLLDQQHALASLPTGAGKSFLAEVFAVKHLAQGQSPILYVVPSRALATEKVEEFSKAFAWQGSNIRVCQLTGEVAYDAGEAFEANDIIVMTPEKLDIVMRSATMEEHLPGGIVVDEFHGIASDTRGFKLQFVIGRLKRKFPAIQSLLISAIIHEDDFQMLASWMGSPNPFELQWKPTPSRIGVANTKGKPVVRVEFNDGTISTVEATRDLPATKRVERRLHTGAMFAVQDPVLEFHHKWRGFWAGSNRLYEVATEYRKAGIAFEPPGSPTRRTEYRQRLERLIGYSGHPLMRAYDDGIGIHWGELALPARRIMEQAIHDECISLVLATTTLAEGINLPFKTVYIPNLHRSVAGEVGPMDKGTFFNVIGRAGRPFLHPEGQVVIGYETKVSDGPDAQPAKDARFYQAMDASNLDRMKSGLLQQAEYWYEYAGQWPVTQLLANPEPVADDLNGQAKERAIGGEARWRRTLAGSIEYVSSGLLACLQEGLCDNLTAGETIDILCLGSESDTQMTVLKEFLTWLEARMEHAGAIARDGEGTKITGWGQFVYKTGLGPMSCRMLDQALQNFHDENSPWRPPGRRRTVRLDAVATHLINDAIWMPLEFRGDVEMRAEGTLLLRDWFKQIHLNQSAFNLKTELGGDSPVKGYIEALRVVESRLSGQAAWTAMALEHLSEFHGYDDLRQAYRFYQEVALYGVSARPLRRILKADSNRLILRDDIVTNWALASALLDPKVSESDLESLVRPRNTRTEPEQFLQSMLEVRRQLLASG